MNLTKIFRRGLDLLPYGGISDRIYLFVIFVYAQRRIPRRGSGLFNDYLYYLKSSPALLDIMRQITSDKILVKDFIEKNCGAGYTLPTRAVFGAAEQIDLSKLRKPCVIKPAHGSGSVVFIEDHHEALSGEDMEVIVSALNTSPYITSREANYRYLRPRLLCEDTLPEGRKVKDYKVFCYAGEPRIVLVESNRFSDHRRNIYTIDWEPLDIRYNFPFGDWEDPPDCLEKMRDLARKVAGDFDFVRVDFFISGGEIYIVELTHCPASAHARFESRNAEVAFSKILFDSEYF